MYSDGGSGYDTSCGVIVSTYSVNCYKASAREVYLEQDPNCAASTPWPQLEEKFHLTSLCTLQRPFISVTA
jgi:hypothetical protein